MLADLGVRVHQLEAETASPDLTYTFDSALVTDRGMIGLRSGKPTRQGEAAPMLEWAAGRDIPVSAGSATARPPTAATRSGFGPTSSASAGRSAPTWPARRG